MQRAILTAGLLLAALTGPATAYDDFYFDDGGFDDGGDWDDGDYYDDGFDDYGGTARKFNYSPFNPGTQNNNMGWNNNGWNNNGWNHGGWNNNHNGGWQQPQHQHWNNQPQYQYQPARPQVVYSQQPIKISMPPNEAGLCAYVLKDGNNGAWNYTIAPGKSQDFTHDRGWLVTFDRGNGFGEQTYSLKPGYYRFRQSSRGWELYHSATAPVDAAPVAQGPPPPM
jgi:hypothetical protein